MRKGIIIIFFVLSMCGCLESQLTPGETQLCLQSTSVQPSIIPDCTSTLDCEKKLSEKVQIHSFQNIRIGAESSLARKGISGTWEKLNRAAKTIEHIHTSCATMKADAILPQAIAGASELQNALKASEDAQRNTFEALEKTIWYGKSLELDKVKDSGAFQQYAILVQRAHEMETSNPTSEWAQMQQENRNYFNHVSAIISKNKTSAYEMEWGSLFDVYKTGVLSIAKKQSKGALTTSSLWKGALAAIMGKSKSVNALSIVTQIRGNEVIEYTEQVVSLENGIIPTLWNEIIDFDQKISILKNEEIELEKKSIEEIEKTKNIFQNQERENENWKRARAQIASWNNVLEKSSLQMGEYQTIGDELTEHTIEMERLSDARNNEMKSLGKRVSEWRELLRKIETTNEKIQQNIKINEKWKNSCQKIADKFFSNEKDGIETAEACVEKLERLNQTEKISEDEKKAVEESRLGWCVSELNEWENAIGEEPTPPEWFEYFEKINSVSGCESALLNVQNNYENNPIVLEGKEKIKKIEMYERILKRLTGTYSKNVFKIDDNEPKPLSEWKKWNEEAEKNILQLENDIAKVLDEGGKKIKWKIVQPEKVLLNELEEITFRGTLFSNLEENVVFSFISSVSNPGIGEIVSNTEGIRVTVEENEIILEGEHLPAGGIWVEGKGKGVGAKVVNETRHVKIMGSTAFVTQLMTIETNFFPIWTKWKLDSSNEIKVKRILNRTSGKNSEKDERGYVETQLPARENIVEVEFEIENSILTNTSVENTRKEWGKEYLEYYVFVENRTSYDAEAAIYTGINGDPSITESVLVSNENGERISETLDAGGNIIIPKQQVGAKQKRKYVIVVEKWEGREEWESIMERLWREADDLQKKGSEKIENITEKIKGKLSALRNEKDTIVIAEKLTPLQIEVSKLLEQYEKEEREKAEVKLEVNPAITIKPESKQEEKGAHEKNSSSRVLEAKNILINAQTKMKEYEKSTNVGCEKLALVNFVCPLPDETVRNYKKIISDAKKIIEKMEIKMTKLSDEKQAEEWVLVESDWNDKIQKMSEVVDELENGLRILRNGTVERAEKLKQETKGNVNEEIQNAVAKATTAYENGEFGKSIYISQNMLNYLNGNKATGLVSLPIETWPFIGIIFLVGVWLGLKEWKKRKNNEIPVQTIPKGNIIPREELFQTNEYVHQSTREEFPQVHKEKAWKEKQVPLSMFELTAEATLPSEQKPKWRQKKAKQY